MRVDRSCNLPLNDMSRRKAASLLEPAMLLRDHEVIRTTLVAAAMVQAAKTGYRTALHSLLVHQFAVMQADELEILAVELGI